MACPPPGLSLRPIVAVVQPSAATAAPCLPDQLLGCRFAWKYPLPMRPDLFDGLALADRHGANSKLRNFFGKYAWTKKTESRVERLCERFRKRRLTVSIHAPSICPLIVRLQLAPQVSSTGGNQCPSFRCSTQRFVISRAWLTTYSMGLAREARIADKDHGECGLPLSFVMGLKCRARGSSAQHRISRELTSNAVDPGERSVRRLLLHRQSGQLAILASRNPETP